jgi:hypothetical protein
MGGGPPEELMSQQLLNVLRLKFQRVRQAKGSDGHLEYRICCPYCPSKGKSADRKFKLYINSGSGAFICWRCSTKGHVRNIIGDVENMNFVQPEQTTSAVTDARQLDKIPPPYDQSGGGLIPIDRLDHDHPAILYLTRLRKRPFDPVELSQVFGVCYCNRGRVFGKNAINFDTTNTLVFPLYWPDPKGTGRPIVVGWQSRLLYDPSKLTENEYAEYGFKRDEKGEWIVPPKYFTSPGMEKGRVLYNYMNARLYDYVVVTEGVFDAFSVGQCAVSLFGKSPTEAQMRLLKTYWNRVIMLLDPGDADAEMEKAMIELRRSVQVTVVTLSGTKDAGDMSREDVWKQIAEQIRQDEMTLGTIATSYEAPAMN